MILAASQGVTAVDAVRLMLFGIFGVGVALMLATNVLAFVVLRPPKKLGFLWWHVAAISTSFLCLGTVDLYVVTTHFGDHATWRTVLTVIGIISFTVAQFIIFNVERARYSAKKVLERGIPIEHQLGL